VQDRVVVIDMGIKVRFFFLSSALLLSLLPSISSHLSQCLWGFIIIILYLL
jgi:hypothetical protein